VAEGIHPREFGHLLFPGIGKHAVGHGKVGLDALRKLFASGGVGWLGPRKFRRTKGNFISRASGSDELAALALQNSVDTFQQSYKEPDTEVAKREWSSFMATIDPATTQVNGAAAGGHCGSSAGPKQTTAGKLAAPEADCLNPAGCWFCDFFAMIESFDFVWAALSQLHLERLKDSLFATRNPADASLSGSTSERIQSRIKQFETRNAEVKSWIEEAQVRIFEEYFHPRWEFLIRMIVLGKGADASN